MPGLAFGAERGVGESIIGRAAYTVDPRRTVAIEGAVRQDGNGAYVKGEYSDAMAQHWRLTVAGIGIGGGERTTSSVSTAGTHISRRRCVFSF